MLDSSGNEDPRDRWSRSDWWGVVLDAPDAAVLARFYSELRGWPIWKMDDNETALDLGEGVAYLARPARPGRPSFLPLHLSCLFSPRLRPVEKPRRNM